MIFWKYSDIFTKSGGLSDNAVQRLLGICRWEKFHFKRITRWTQNQHSYGTRNTQQKMGQNWLWRNWENEKNLSRNKTLKLTTPQYLLQVGNGLNIWINIIINNNVNNRCLRNEIYVRPPRRAGGRLLDIVLFGLIMVALWSTQTEPIQLSKDNLDAMTNRYLVYIRDWILWY